MLVVLILALAIVAIVAIATAVLARNSHLTFMEELYDEFTAARGDMAKFGAAVWKKL